MKFKIVISITAILSFLNGVFFILAPAFSLSILGRETNPTGIMNTRFFGACALGLAIIGWLARDTKYPEVQRLVSIGMLTSLFILAVIDLNGILTGAMNSLGWVLFLADLSLSVGFFLSILTGGGKPR